MDKLTLIALAENAPDTPLMDGDGDHWHAQCVLRWMNQMGESMYTRLMHELTTSTAAGRCYKCGDPTAPKGAIWMP